MSINLKFEKNQFNIEDDMNFWNSKFYKELYVGEQSVLQRLPTNMHFLDFEFQKNSYFINNKPLFLKLMIFTNFNMVFPVVVLVFDFEEFSEEV
jgi:hypothetical protein